MTFLITLLLTFALVVVALLVFWQLGPPVYRIDRRNVIKLLEMVVAGHATDSDWQVFTGFPIRHDAELAAIQQRCVAIAEREYTAGEGMLFTRRGCGEIAAILAELKAAESVPESPDDKP